MKRIVKKVFAFILAMALCVTQLAMPVLADTQDPSTAAAPAAPQAISPDTPLPAAPGDAYDSSYQFVDHGPGGASEIVTETWTKSEVTDAAPTSSTSTPADPADGSSSTTDTTGNVIVTKEGEQTTTTTYTPSSASQGVVGQEDITTTDTTKTVTTTEDVTLVDDPQTKPVDEIVGDVVDSGKQDYSGEASSADGVTETGTPDTYASIPELKEEIKDLPNGGSVSIDVGNHGDVVLNMTPGGNTATQTFTVPIDHILPDEGFDANGLPYAEGATVTFNGEAGWTVNYQRDKDGKVTGVTFSKVASQTDNKPSADNKDWTPTGNGEFTDTGASTTTALPTNEYTSYTPSYTDIDDSTKTITLPTVTEYKETTTPLQLTDGAGNKVERTITPVYDQNDPTQIVAYKVTDVVTTTSGKGYSNTTTQNTTTIDPVKPVAAAPTIKDGIKTTQSVEEVRDSNGKLQYYRLTTVMSDAMNGTVYFTEHHDYYGGEATTTETIVDTPTEDVRTITVETVIQGTKETFTGSREATTTVENTQVLDVESYEVVNGENGVYIKYMGKMYEVQGLSGHGDIDDDKLQRLVNSLVPTAKPNGSNDLTTPGSRNYDGDAPESGADWEYSRYGLETAHNAIHGTDASGTKTHQFVLTDGKGNEVYVLCVDYSSSAKQSADYNMENVVDADYFDEAETAKKVEAIAVNGYWGTESGKAGSLSTVKQFLKDQVKEGLKTANANTDLGKAMKAFADSVKSTYSNGDENYDYEDFIDAYLTDGLALTATQAALWFDGHSGTHTAADTNAMLSNVIGSSPTDIDKLVGNALFKALIYQDVSKVDDSTEFLDADNAFTSSTLTIKGTVTKKDLETFEKDYQITEGTNNTVYSNHNKNGTDVNGDVLYTDKDGRTLYKADLQFTFDVKASDLTGNLNLTVKDDNGDIIARKTIVTEDSNLFGKILAGDLTGGKSQITFENLLIADGVRLNLTIDGTQDLEEGAYLYTATGGYGDSQTFIGVASGKREVNLSVGLSFNVEDPSAKVQKKAGQITQNDKDSFKRTEYDTRYENEIEVNSTLSYKDTVKGTRVSTKIVTEKITEERQWNSYIEYLYDLTTGDGGAGGGGDDGDGNGLTIPDELVPLAAAPKTGDASQLFAVVSLISLSGSLLLKKKEF